MWDLAAGVTVPGGRIKLFEREKEEGDAITNYRYHSQDLLLLFALIGFLYFDGMQQ